MALLNPLALGLPVSGFIQVALERQGEAALAAFERALRERPAVMECYLTTGETDYLLQVIVPDGPSLERFIVDFLAKVPGVGMI